MSAFVSVIQRHEAGMQQKYLVKYCIHDSHSVKDIESHNPQFSHFADNVIIILSELLWKFCLDSVRDITTASVVMKDEMLGTCSKHLCMVGGGEMINTQNIQVGKTECKNV
jgi:hypothetical protein